MCDEGNLLERWNVEERPVMPPPRTTMSFGGIEINETGVKRLCVRNDVELSRETA